jgi:hypothetical protein
MELDGHLAAKNAPELPELKPDISFYDTFYTVADGVEKNEVEYRKAKKIKRLIKQAKFYTVKTFEGYSFDEIRIPSGLSIEDLKTGTFIEKNENLILYGAAGRENQFCFLEQQP